MYVYLLVFTSINKMQSNTTINVCIAKRCFHTARLNNDMFQLLYRISCTSIKFVFKITAVTVELKSFFCDKTYKQHKKLGV